MTFYGTISEMFQRGAHPVFLAPMAGFTDPPFRALCRKAGADAVVAEMVSAKAVIRRNAKTLAMLQAYPGERPVVWQIFGCEGQEMAEAAAYIESLGEADGIDVNLGCPMPKVTGPGSGAALLRDVERTAALLAQVVRAVKLPVSCKMRSGWDAASIVAPDMAVAAAAAGCAYVHVHGRTSKQLYSGRADLEVIRRVKESCPVPVVGNGDIVDPADATRMFELTGCDGVSIARGALGNPWLFSRIKAYLTTGRVGDEPGWQAKVAAAETHFRVALEYCHHAPGCHRGLKGHLVKYFTGHPGAAALRRRLGSVQSNGEMEALIREAREG